MDGIERYRLNQLEVICLKDGDHVFDENVFPSVDPELRQQRLDAAGLPAISTEFNAYVLRHSDGSVDLIDAGCGTLFGPSGGALPQRLAALGISPDQVRKLYFTHLHRDHFGGAFVAGNVAFPNAELHLSRIEFELCQGQESPAGEMLAAYQGKTILFEDKEELFAGMSAWLLPGHTLGHCGFRFGDELVLVGDILHSAALQLPDPDVTTIYDSAPELGRASRRAALEEIADRGVVWSGSHNLSGMKFARLARKGAGFHAIPL